jgi:hypothetical protein
MAISRMQQPRQMYNQGGYADMGLMAPRQNYGLGSFVKKAVRGVKKIAKSPLGKMALLGAGGALAGSFMSGGVGAGLGRFSLANLGNFGSGTLGALKSGEGMMGGIGDMFRKGGESGADFSMGRMLAGGLGATALAMPFLGGKEEPEVAEEQMDPAYQTQRARDYYSQTGTKGVGLDFMPKKKYVQGNFYAADGGRAGYAMGGSLDEDEEDYIRSGAGQSRRQPTAFLNMGGGAGEAQAEQMLMAEFVKYKNKGGDLSFEQFVQAVMQQQNQSQGMEQPTMMAANGGMAGTSVPGYGTPAGTNQFGYPSGGTRVNAAEGGIMETEQASEMIDMGGNEKDYRETGGFVEMGGEERADDVPARLSKNEFVFTADAVRNAGGGDIDRGSEVMQNLMDNLEQGGQVSEDSQGLGGGEEIMSEEMIEEPDGAQAMYEQQQALQSRMI